MRSSHPLSKIALIGAAFSLAAVASCNYSPISGLEKSLTIRVETGSGTNEAIKIDFLWVVDNSSSMCEEQLALTRSFSDFTSTLGSLFQLDPRVAVTTHDAQCAADSSSAQGVFNRWPAAQFPPPCQERRIFECLDDSDCASAGCDEFGVNCEADFGEWTCRAPSSASCLTNPNGTKNSQCVRRCTSDSECQQAFSDPSYVCQKPSQTQSDWGCIRPPETSECPADIPAVLTGDNLDLFGCLATVGVNQEKCLKYEQGMRSALLSLKPDARLQNDDPLLFDQLKAQAETFLRDDAYLVVIFISDEDDCSVAYDQSIQEDDYETCALLKTTAEGGPLVPVSHYVNIFKSLKSDPGRVIVAAIAGDSVASAPADVEADREAYIASKGDPKTCYHQSYICLSENGKADYGRRYRELTDSFGPNGVFENICNNEGIQPALDQIASTIITVLNKICLPKEIEDDLRVTRQTADGTEAVTEGDGPDQYKIVEGAEDCARDGVLLPAIAFNRAPEPGEAITITYEGEPGLDL